MLAAAVIISSSSSSSKRVTITTYGTPKSFTTAMLTFHHRKPRGVTRGDKISVISVLKALIYLSPPQGQEPVLVNSVPINKFMVSVQHVQVK